MAVTWDVPHSRPHGAGQPYATPVPSSVCLLAAAVQGVRRGPCDFCRKLPWSRPEPLVLHSKKPLDHKESPLAGETWRRKGGRDFLRGWRGGGGEAPPPEFK